MSSRDPKSSAKRKSSDIDAEDSSSKRTKISDMPSNDPTSSNSTKTRSSNTKITSKEPQCNGEISKYFSRQRPSKKSNTNSTSNPTPTSPPSNDPPSSSSDNDTKTTTSHLKLTETLGNIFHNPIPNPLLIHACNTEGTWGAGIAQAFKTHYPSAFRIYTTHCALHGGDLLSKALLIPPQPGDSPPGEGVFIGCLFTSRYKGRKKDSPKKILESTGPAMGDLMRLVREWEGEKVGRVRMCKINSGLFGVKWERTRAVLEGIEVGEGEFVRVEVVERET